MAWTLGIILQLIGGALVLILGLAVLLVKPRTRPAIWFAVFAISFGSQFIISNLAFGLDVPLNTLWYTGGRILVRLLFITSALGLVFCFPRPLEENDRKAVFVAGLLSGIGLVANLVIHAGLDIWTYGILYGIASFTFWAMFATLYFMLFLFSARYAEVTTSEKDRSQYILVSYALLFYTGLVAGIGGEYGTFSSILSQDPSDILRGAINLLLMVLLSAYWLLNTRHGQPSSTRNVALLALFMPLIGLLHVLYIPDYGLFGLVRILMVTTIAYAIVRHQLLGIHVKIRWTISKTTLAGIFVAVFFVASEVAQQFFGERLGGPYVGIIAAGLLVFAIAPLSRFTDRLAERAIPLDEESDGPHPGLSAEGLERAYSAGVRAAMRDGVITRREERHLAELADNLGIPAARALMIRERVEEEEAEPPGV